MKKLLIFILSVFSSFFLFASSVKGKATKVTPEKLCLDIQKIQLDMEFSAVKDLYDPQPFEELKADVMAGKVDKIECIYRLKEIFSSYHVMHLQLRTTSDNYDFGSVILPFYFRCYGKDYHVMTAPKQYEKLLGARLLEIGGFPLEEVINRLAKYGSYETPSGEKYCLNTIITYNTIKRAGLAEKNGKIKLKFQLADGELETITCKALDWRKNNKFISLYPHKENPLFSIQDMNSSYGIKASKENKTVYLHLNTINGDPDYLFTTLFDDLKNELKKNIYETLVFDLRYNSGGMATYASLLSNLLSVNRGEFSKYNLALVTSGNTYSAACWFVNDFLMYFPETVIFGEETGQAIFNYTDVYYSNILKNLQCDFMFPQAVDTMNEYLIKRAEEVTHSDLHRGTMPDVEVSENFDDFMNGEDAIYKAIYDYFN